MTNQPHVSIVGATGAVGREMLVCLEERNFPLSQLTLLASAKSAGQNLTFRGEISDPQVGVPATPDKQTQQQQLEEQNREVKEQQVSASVNQNVNVQTTGDTNVNNQTALVANQNHNTQDTNDRSWFGGYFG